MIIVFVFYKIRKFIFQILAEMSAPYPVGIECHFVKFRRYGNGCHIFIDIHGYYTRFFLVHGF